MIEVRVPTVGESINEVTLAAWKIKEGDYVFRDDVICELESEKATFDLSAEQGGTVTFKAKEGDDLAIGDLICMIDDAATPPEKKEDSPERKEIPIPETKQVQTDIPAKATPLAKELISENKIDVKNISGTGPGGKITRNDVLEYISVGATGTERSDDPKKMSNLRKTISRRLVEAKNTTAMLTTFNEVDMSAILDLRKSYKEKFAEKHGIGLGFMSFFTRACAIALQEWPSVNAYLNEDEIIYHNYVDISIAVSAPKGLVVPVIRNAHMMTMADIEREVKSLATKARDNKLSIEEMTGGTFTITNGGVFGSLLSTPILNIPQSAILGMHKIEERPVAISGQVQIRPMMYVALSYDHRIIDGRESVGFLVRVKELLEDPTKMIAAKNVNDILFDL